MTIFGLHKSAGMLAAILLVMPGCEKKDFKGGNGSTSRPSPQSNPGGTGGSGQPTPRNADQFGGPSNGTVTSNINPNGLPPTGPNGQWVNPTGNFGLPNGGIPGLNGFGGDTPLVLDWNRDGKIELASNKVWFDIDADGKRELTEWIGANDAILALDINGNGMVDSGRELFGNATILMKNLKAAAEGFAALSGWDANRDAFIDRGDRIFPHLLLWQDSNNDGISQKSELTRVINTDIMKLHLSNQKVDPKSGRLAGGESYVGLKSSYTTKASKTHAFVDVFFHVNRDASMAVLMPAASKEVVND